VVEKLYLGLKGHLV